MTDNSNNDDSITVTTDEQALALVLKRAKIEVDELYEIGEEEFADEAAAAHRQVKTDFEAAREDN